MSRLILFLLTLLVPALARAQNAPIPPKDHTVVDISLDGFPVWLWADPHAAGADVATHRSLRQPTAVNE